MAAPEPQPVLWEIISGLTVAACIGLGRLISGKASKEDLAEAVQASKEQQATMLERVDEHYEDAKLDRGRLLDEVKEINRALGATMISLSRLQGRLNGDDDERRGR